MERRELMKPCDNCTVNIQQYLDHDEITCYLTCKKFKEWRKANG